jgi:hypothetical protein
MLSGRPLCLGALCFVLLFSLRGAAGVRAQDVPREYQVKAAFVFRFAHYVEWPEAATDKRTTLEYCVWPPNPFGESLRQLVAGEVLGGRRLVVRDLTPTASLATCHVLFLHGGAIRPALAHVRSQPVLTVSDTPGFLDEGGIIQLVRTDNRLVFDISLPAAERAGLRLSSHLLRLAGTLRGGN